MNLIRNIIGLIITITMLPLCALAFEYTGNLNLDYDQINDEIALCQLRESLLIAYNIDVKKDCLSFTYKAKQNTLSLINRKLILQPGTQIYLNDIDYLRFEEAYGCIYINYERNNTKYKRVLCDNARFYLDDFSDCDDECAIADSTQE